MENSSTYVKQLRDEKIAIGILAKGGISLYYNTAVINYDIELLVKKGYEIIEFDAELMPTDNELHFYLQEKLHFPGYYGGNFDALNDCLRDYEVPPSGDCLANGTSPLYSPAFGRADFLPCGFRTNVCRHRVFVCCRILFLWPSKKKKQKDPDSYRDGAVCPSMRSTHEIATVSVISPSPGQRRASSPSVDAVKRLTSVFARRGGLFRISFRCTFS